MKDTLTIQSQCQETIKNQVQFSWLAVVLILAVVWLCISAIGLGIAGILYLIF